MTPTTIMIGAAPRVHPARNDDPRESPPMLRFVAGMTPPALVAFLARAGGTP